MVWSARVAEGFGSGMEVRTHRLTRSATASCAASVWRSGRAERRVTSRTRASCSSASASKRSTEIATDSRSAPTPSTTASICGGAYSDVFTCSGSTQSA